MKRIALLLGLGSALAWTPCSAQAGNGSDITGPITTGGEIAGGAFAPRTATAADASPAASAALRAAGAGLAAELSAGAVSTGVLPAEARLRVLAVLTGEAPPASLGTALASSGSPAAGELARALDGLLAAPSAGQLTDAVAHFNVLVADAPPAFLAAPPAEFLAVHAVLSRLASALDADR